MEPLRVVVADDDEPICNLLKGYLCSFDEVEVVGSVADGEKLVEVVRETSPDAVFLDIRMPGLDGLASVHSLQNEFPSLFVVFVSSYTHYAVDAFNLDAVDFVAKPFTRDRLAKSLNKLKRFKELSALTQRNGKSLTGARKTGFNSQLALKCGHGITMVERESIFFLEKQGKKTIVHTTRGRYETTSSLHSLESTLEKPDFFRCHKSFVINVKHVEKIIPYADRTYEISFYGYPLKVPMRREKFVEFCSLFDSDTL